MGGENRIEHRKGQIKKKALIAVAASVLINVCVQLAYGHYGNK